VKHFDALLPHMAPDGALALDDISFSWDLWHARTNISRASA